MFDLIFSYIKNSDRRKWNQLVPFYLSNNNANIKNFQEMFLMQNLRAFKAIYILLQTLLSLCFSNNAFVP